MATVSIETPSMPSTLHSRLQQVKSADADKLREKNLHLVKLMETMLKKLEATTKPSYLACLSIAKTSQALVSELRNNVRLAGEIERPLMDIEQAREMVDVSKQTQELSGRINQNLINLYTHFQHLGITFMVRKDLSAIIPLATTFCEYLIESIPENENEGLIFEAVHITQQMMQSMEEARVQFGIPLE